MRVLPSALVVLLACVSADALAGPLLIVPPTRVDVSPVLMESGADRAIGTRLAIGIHWASGSARSDLACDLGVGYSYEHFDGADRQRQVAREPLGGATSPPERPEYDLHGPYLELSKRVGPAHPHQRAFVGFRAELLRSDDDGAYGAGVSGRAAWELYKSVRHEDEGGLAWGALAIGAFVEIGVRRLPDGRNAVRTSAGLSLRLPIVIVD